LSVVHCPSRAKIKGGRRALPRAGCGGAGGHRRAAVTDRRLLCFKISSPVGLGIGGDVKELVSEAPLAEVDSIEVKRLAVGETLTVSVRGTSFVLEVGAGANAKGVAEEFERAQAPA